MICLLCSLNVVNMSKSLPFRLKDWQKFVIFFDTVFGKLYIRHQSYFLYEETVTDRSSVLVSTTDFSPGDSLVSKGMIERLKTGK